MKLQASCVQSKVKFGTHMCDITILIVSKFGFDQFNILEVLLKLRGGFFW